MSAEAFIYVRSLRLHLPARKLIMQTLADRADEAFSCYPGVPLVAAECELKPRMVQRHLAWLREHGYLSDRVRYRPDGSQTSNRYFLHGPWDDYGGTGRPFEQVAYPDYQAADGPFRSGTKAAGGMYSGTPGGMHSSTPPPRTSVHGDGVLSDAGATSSVTSPGVPNDAPKSALEDTPGVHSGAGHEPPEEPPVEAPPPPPVVTAEERAGAREGEEQKGAASPRDLSAATAGGAAGASPTGGPAVAKSAPVELRLDRMAADVVCTLPRVLQPATDDEREAIRWLIADKLSEGYPVAVVRQVLTADPPEYVKAKAAFVGHRLDHMAPWVPPARPAADRAAVDEIRSRQAAQAGTVPPPSAAAARAAFEASRGRRPGQQAQQQGAGDGPADS